MYELMQVTERDRYIVSPAKAGLVITGEGEAVLIDSGSDESAGRKIRQILEREHLNLRAILNTHFHADHIGGNAFLQKRTGCRIYAPEGELSFVRHPIREPSLLYGATPPAARRHKFLMAQESDALPLSQEALAEIVPEGLELLSLPGHSPDMKGFRTKDGTVYLADCLSSEETIGKYGLVVIYDVGQYLETLQKVTELSGNCFVPAHAEPTVDIRPLARFNIDAVEAAAERIEALCGDGTVFDDLLGKVFTSFGLAMSMEQYVLIGSTVKAYLTWLSENGRVKAEFRETPFPSVVWEKAD